MKVHEASLFYTENLVAGIKARANQGMVDRFLLGESNRTFKYAPKPYVFDVQAPHVRCVRIDGDRDFVPPRLGIKRKFPFVGRKNPGWTNEAIQRNFCAASLLPDVADDDVVILSDVDEIIDWSHRDKLLDLVREHGIVTIRLHFTMFFFDLFSVDWPGPPDYSGRVFLMTGRHFRNLDLTSDQLRKKGERGELLGKVHCPDEIMGFHHSWAGDVDFVAAKIQAYAHDAADHADGLFRDGACSPDTIREFLSAGRSFFPDHHVVHRPDIPLLPEVEAMRAIRPDLFFGAGG